MPARPSASPSTLGSAVQGGLGDAFGDVTSGFENLLGSGHNDTLTGDLNANTIIGQAASTRSRAGWATT